MLSDIYQLGIVSGGSDEEVLTLLRAVGNEIVLASVFGLIAASDVSVPFGPMTRPSMPLMPP